MNTDTTFVICSKCKKTHALGYCDEGGTIQNAHSPSEVYAKPKALKLNVLWKNPRSKVKR
jgi:hypothetical protein